MPKCPYNESVECSQDARDAEFKRQIQIVMRGGGYWLHKGQGGCNAQKALCYHLAHAQKTK